MSDLYALPPLPTNFNNSLDSVSTGSGAFSSSSLAGDLAQMEAGSVPGLPGGSTATSSTGFSPSTLLSGITGALNTSGTSGTTSTPSTSTSTSSSGLTSFTSDSLIGRILFFLLGLVFMAGAVYTYKK